MRLGELWLLQYLGEDDAVHLVSGGVEEVRVTPRSLKHAFF